MHKEKDNKKEKLIHKGDNDVSFPSISNIDGIHKKWFHYEESLLIDLNLFKIKLSKKFGKNNWKDFILIKNQISFDILDTVFQFDIESSKSIIFFSK